MLRLILGVLTALALGVPAFGQGALLQGGPWTPGHAPMYVGSGQQGSQTVVQDSGPAGGGATGLGLGETLQVNRGAAGTGTGPLGTHNCEYDAPVASGSYHYLCFDANAQGGGLIAYGAGGTATALPLSIIINGVQYQFPFATGGRIVLTAPLTFYVDVGSGSDVAACGRAASTSACKTIQYAVNILSRSYDFGGQTATIQLAHGTYTSVLVSQPWTGGNSVTLLGDLASQSSVIIDGAGGTYCVEVANYGALSVQGLTVQNCALELSAAFTYGQIFFQNITFNAPTTGGVGVYCSRLSYCEAGLGNIINAVGANFIQASHQGQFRAATGGTPFTIGANIALSSGAFVYTSSLGDVTFTNFSASAFNLNGHTVTGRSWQIDTGGLIQTVLSLSTFFPGNATGVLIGQGSFNGGSHVGTTIFSGGGASPSIVGNDYDGVVTEGAGSTGVVLLFGAAFDTAPVCTVTYWGAPTTPAFAVATTTLGTTHDAGTAKFSYHCSGG